MTLRSQSWDSTDTSTDNNNNLFPVLFHRCHSLFLQLQSYFHKHKYYTFVWLGSTHLKQAIKLEIVIQKEEQFCKMDGLSWPSKSELDAIREKVAKMSGGDGKEVRFVVSPFRICPLGAHIDHQGGTVSAMTINKGILLGFVPSDDSQKREYYNCVGSWKQGKKLLPFPFPNIGRIFSLKKVRLSSGQFKGEVRFRIDEIQLPKYSNSSNDSIQVKEASKSWEECNWGSYARGALYALQKRGNYLRKGIIGFIYGSDGLDSSGLSSSAAVGIAYLMAFENANNLTISPTENIEYDRLIENEYLGLRNGILDQSAILLSSYGCLTCMNCKTKEYKLIQPPNLLNGHQINAKSAYKILLALSGLKQALTTNPGYNRRVAECREAARILLQASGKETLEPLLSNVEPDTYETYKNKLEPNLAKRAEHYFSENKRVMKGLEAWASGNLKDFGKLISESGFSSIKNYESGCEPLIQLYEILRRAPGVFGARFSGAGFRGCCIAFVDADCALEAASFIKNEYGKLQPKLASQINQERAVIICDAGDCARII